MLVDYPTATWRAAPKLTIVDRIGRLSDVATRRFLSAVYVVGWMVVHSKDSSRKLSRQTDVVHRKGKADFCCCLDVSGEHKSNRQFWELRLAKFVNKDVVSDIMDSSQLSSRCVLQITNHEEQSLTAEHMIFCNRWSVKSSPSC